jgi:hypothetical protein
MHKVCSESVAQLLRPDREEAMKKILAALLLSSWCGCTLAQTAQELIDNGKDSENVTTFGMGFRGTNGAIYCKRYNAIGSSRRCEL